MNFELNNNINSSKEKELPGFDDDTNNDELPSFDNKNTINRREEVEVPLPPPELSARPAIIRLQDIEDDYLDTEPSRSDIDNIKKELKRENKKSPIFVNLDEYGVLLSTVRSTNGNIKTFANISNNIQNLHSTQKDKIKKMNELFEEIQRKLIMVDNSFFDKDEV